MAFDHHAEQGQYRDAPTYLQPDRGIRDRLRDGDAGRNLKRAPHCNHLPATAEQLCRGDFEFDEIGKRRGQLSAALCPVTYFPRHRSADVGTGTARVTSSVYK